MPRRRPKAKPRLRRGGAKPKDDVVDAEFKDVSDDKDTKKKSA